MLILLSPGGIVKIDAATSNTGVGTDISLNQCTSNYQDRSISTNGEAYFSHCMVSSCESNTYNTQYYSSNSVSCSNGNRTPYFKIHKNGCSKYQGLVCNQGDKKYCSLVMYYDCSRITNGDKFVTTTTKTTTKNDTYRPPVTSTTTTTTVAPVNTNLKSLTLSNGSINFSPDVLSYNLNLDSNITSISVYPIPEDSNSRASVTGNTNIVNGSVITITVTGSDGSIKEYKINVTKESANIISDNTKLKSLKVEGYSIQFNPNKKSYNLTINSGVTQLNIDYEPEDSSSIVLISDNNNLKNGSEITISVTAESGDVDYYKLIITVKEKSNFISILFIIIIILALVAGGFYIYKKFVATKSDGGKYEYE